MNHRHDDCGCRHHHQHSNCNSGCECGQYTDPCTGLITCANPGTLSYALRIANSWNIPSCQTTAIISVPGLTTLMIGSYITNHLYGTFKITAYDVANDLVTILNECLVGTKPAGTVVPACTDFLVIGQPFTAPGSFALAGVLPYLALDFVAPALSVPLTIHVTNVNGLFVGETIQIGTGFYTIESIPTATTVIIQNDGSGITPGSVVSAFTGLGLYQYPLVLAGTCCSTLAGGVYVVTSAPQTGTVSTANHDVLSNVASVSITNSSPYTKYLHLVLNGRTVGTLNNCNTDDIDLVWTLLASVNGGGMAPIANEEATFFMKADTAKNMTKVIQSFDTISIAPGVTHTLDLELRVHWTSAGNATYAMTEIYSTLVGIGISI